MKENNLVMVQIDDSVERISSKARFRVSMAKKKELIPKKDVEVVNVHVIRFDLDKWVVFSVCGLTILGVFCITMLTTWMICNTIDKSFERVGLTIENSFGKVGSTIERSLEIICKTYITHLEILYKNERKHYSSRDLIQTLE